jgi:hypothetical protein
VGSRGWLVSGDRWANLLGKSVLTSSTYLMLLQHSKLQDKGFNITNYIPLKRPAHVVYSFRSGRQHQAVADSIVGETLSQEVRHAHQISTAYWLQGRRLPAMIERTLRRTHERGARAVFQQFSCQLYGMISGVSHVSWLLRRPNIADSLHQSSCSRSFRQDDRNGVTLWWPADRATALTIGYPGGSRPCSFHSEQDP